jgi:hypothetical protein
MKYRASLLALLASVTLVACGPVKGYSGPELPSSQLVTIAMSDVSPGFLQDCMIDWTSCAHRSVQVRVGHHMMKTVFSLRGTPENCGMEREFDNCDSCREAREASCRDRNPDNLGLCGSMWLSEEMHVMCDFPHSLRECRLEATITEPGEYRIAVLSESDDVRLMGRNLDIPLTCTQVATSWHRERMR